MMLFGRIGRLVGWRKKARQRVSSPPDSLPTSSVRRPATPRAVAPAALPAPDMQDLEAQARYHRDRLALYRARVLSAKPASATRLRELEQTSAAADARLSHAARRDARACKEGDRHRPL